MPGWNVEAISSGLDGRHHIIKITTPTGHTYLSGAPQTEAWTDTSVVPGNDSPRSYAQGNGYRQSHKVEDAHAADHYGHGCDRRPAPPVRTDAKP